MSDHTTSGPGTAPEPGELELRKALSAMNDLEPPRDDLFAQRALMRGRARTSRRRSTLLGAAAAVVVVAAVGGSWVATTHGGPSDSVSSGSAQSGQGASAGSGGAESLRGSARPGGPGAAPSVPSARDAVPWFGTLSTPQTLAFDAIEPTVTSRWPDVFSGAYAVTPVGDRVAVAVTRHDPELEAFVTKAMPAPTDVEFVIRAHSIAEKSTVAQQILDQRTAWRDKGVGIVSVTQDGRADQVLVVVDQGSDPDLLRQQYGDVVRVVLPTQLPQGKLPDGSTLPPLER